MNRNDTEFIVQKIRTQYTEKNESVKNLDVLRELDAEVKRPANIFGYLFGSISAIIMGTGMSLVMTNIGEKIGISSSMPLGIAIGVIGMIMAISTYPIYKKLLASRKAKYADEIIKLSDKIMSQEEN